MFKRSFEKGDIIDIVSFNNLRCIAIGEIVSVDEKNNTAILKNIFYSLQHSDVWRKVGEQEVPLDHLFMKVTDNEPYMKIYKKLISTYNRAPLL